MIAWPTCFPALLCRATLLVFPIYGCKSSAISPVGCLTSSSEVKSSAFAGAPLAEFWNSRAVETELVSGAEIGFPEQWQDWPTTIEKT
jgi:hypothetical protein